MEVVAFWTWALFVLLALNAIPELIVQFWFNQSLGFRTIFWKNLQMQVMLFGMYGSILALAVYAPVWLHARSRTLRTAGLHGSIWIGILGGWILARYYQQFLLALHGVPFGSLDPVFSRDLGFYVYLLPTWRLALAAIEAAILLSFISCFVARYDELASTGALRRRGLGIWGRLGPFAVPHANRLVYLLGSVGALHIYLGRYGLLLKDNEPTGVRTGAAYLDLVGVFSTLNNVYVLAGVEIGLTLIVGISLSRLYRHYAGRERSPAVSSGAPVSPQLPVPPLSLRRLAWAGVALLALQLCFSLGVIVRDYVFVQPNEPYIQQEYIKRHIEATTDAYKLNAVEVHEWIPPEQPLSTAALLSSQTIQNAPLVAPWVSYLEEPPDIQHLERMAVSKSTMVFGPLLQTYQQQQQLRPYYKFLSVDGVRYAIDGQKRMFASAVRELPSLALVGQQEWLKYWGSAALLDPADLPPGVNIGKPGDLQYAMLMPFTPESGRNLRSLVIALQDPGNYGRLISLQIPQGMFVPGPEQIDAYIDNDRPVHQQVTMWIRHATEVIRGRTLLLPVGGDLMYIETIWVNSLQNDMPQLKLVAMRYRDRITSGATLDAAIGKRELFEPADRRPVDAGQGAPVLAEALVERESRQGGGDGWDGHEQADPDEAPDADVHTLAAQHLQPQQVGEGAHGQQARP